MSFFDAPQPPPEPKPQRQPWRGDSSDTVGGIADLVVFLARNVEAAVVVGGVVGYPSGFSLNVVSFTRLFESGPRWRGPHGGEPDDTLRFGVRFSDGSKVIDNPSHYPLVGPRSDGRWLQRRGGGGGGRKWTAGYWCDSLPPPGLMAFVCEWPRYGIALTEAEVDAGIILDAAEHAYPIWPDDVGLPAPTGPRGPQPTSAVAIQRSAFATGHATAVRRSEPDARDDPTG